MFDFCRLGRLGLVAISSVLSFCEDMKVSSGEKKALDDIGTTRKDEVEGGPGIAGKWGEILALINSSTRTEQPTVFILRTARLAPLRTDSSGPGKRIIGSNEGSPPLSGLHSRHMASTVLGQKQGSFAVQFCQRCACLSEG